MAHSTLIRSFLLLFVCKGVSGVSFTFVNKCGYTVWPGILGTPALDTTGFELTKGDSRSFQAPAGWSGRFWGRTGCTFDATGNGTCATADCGSGQVQCNGAGATPPTTLAEFTLGSDVVSQDFYDVSLVDGYNIQMVVEVSGGSGNCGTTGCVEDLNMRCPTELRVEGGGACRSACDAFGKEEYCCKGAYNSPAVCKPTVYSRVFKSACPKSYSYAYDDATSTFTCTAADYVITFCPSPPSQTASRDSSKSNNGSAQSGSEPGSGSMEALSANGSLLADLAAGDSTLTHSSPPLQFITLIVTAISVLHTFLIL